jgi:hypothetical protein
MKPFKAKDDLQVWLCENGQVAFCIGYASAELSAKEAGKLIIYLTRLLMKGRVK